MFNQEILGKLEERYGTQKTADFCELISMVYKLKYESTDSYSYSCRGELDFEREWWEEACVALRQKLVSCSPKNS